MKLLEEKILKEGRLLPGNILKVDSFLNHQIDPEIMLEMGKEFANHFKDRGITKVITLEVSGIVMAMTTAQQLGVRMVFAKKTDSKTLVDDVWESKVFSYTKNKEYSIRVSKSYLSESDKVLIIDDFLAKGKAIGGMVDLCKQAGAEVIGVGIAIEKAFQEGGREFRENGLEIYSLAKIKEFKDGEVIFE